MNIRKFGAAVLVGAMVAGCGQQGKDAADALAVEVNGAKLMQSEIDRDVAAIVKAQGDKIPAEQIAYARERIGMQIAQSFVIEKVLVGKAKAEKFVVTDAERKARTDEFLKATAGMPDAPKSLEDYFKKFPLGAERAKEEFENGMLIDKMIKEYQKKQPKKDYTAEAKKIVDGVVSNNAVAAKAGATSEKRIRELKAQLDKVAAAKGDVAKTFAELAKKESACPSSAKGGDLGEFTHGQMVKEFDEVAFKMPVGKVSDPVKTQFGWHLILVTAKTPAVEAKGDKPAAPEKVKASHILVKSAATQEVPKAEEIVSRLQKQDERKFLQEFILGQIKAAKITTADAYKSLIPQDEPKAAPTSKAPAQKPVDKSAKK